MKTFCFGLLFFVMAAVVFSALEETAAVSLNGVCDVQTSGGYLYVLTQSGIITYDITDDPLHPRIVRVISFAPANKIINLVVYHNYAAVYWRRDDETKILVYDVQHPNDPLLYDEILPDTSLHEFFLGGFPINDYYGEEPTGYRGSLAQMFIKDSKLRLSGARDEDYGSTRPECEIPIYTFSTKELCYQDHDAVCNWPSPYVLYKNHDLIIDSEVLWNIALKDCPEKNQRFSYCMIFHESGYASTGLMDTNNDYLLLGYVFEMVETDSVYELGFLYCTIDDFKDGQDPPQPNLGLELWHLLDYSWQYMYFDEKGTITRKQGHYDMQDLYVKNRST